MVKAGRIDAEADRIVDHLAVDIDGDEVGGGDLFEAQAIGVDEKTVMGARQPCGNMGVDAVVEAETVDQPVGRGEVAARPLIPIIGAWNLLGSLRGRHGQISQKLIGADKVAIPLRKSRLNCRQSTPNMCTSGETGRRECDLSLRRWDCTPFRKMISLAKSPAASPRPSSRPARAGRPAGRGRRGP